MNKASEDLNFEEALEYRNIINNLEAISEKQKMETNLNNSDIFNYAIKDDYINIQVFHVRDTKVIERNCFTFDFIDDSNADNKNEVFVNFVHQFYLINNNPIPKEIILPNVDVSKFDPQLARVCIIPKQGRKKELLDLVLVNINKELENLILKKQRAFDMTQGAVNQLASLLRLEDANDIEAFDNSNIQGVSAVSAMVKYINGVKEPKEYRKYKIKTIEKIKLYSLDFLDNTIKYLCTNKYILIFYYSVEILYYLP